LPTEAKDPVIQKGTGFTFALMYLAARSDTMKPAAIDGVLDAGGSAALRHGQRRFPMPKSLGAQEFAMRVWIDPVGGWRRRMVTATDVLTAITSSNFLVGAGQDQERVLRLLDRGEDDAAGPGQTFGELPVRSKGSDIVRLRDGRQDRARRCLDRRPCPVQRP